MKKPFRMVPEALIPPFTVIRKTPAIGSYRIPYAKGVCWRGADWWISLQWHDAKHTYIYCLEIHTSTDISLQLECLYTDIHWLYLLQGGLSLADRCNAYTLQGMEHTQYLAVQDHMVLSAARGRHILMGFTVAHEWLTRYILDGLDFLPTMHQTTTPIHAPRPTTPAMLSEILQLLTLPLSARLLQDTAIYGPIARLVELEREAHLTAGVPSPNPRDRSRELADAVHHYVVELVRQDTPIPPISEVAEHFHVHPDHLSRCHRTHYGQSLKPFAREQLLHRAHVRLQTGERVSDVASSLGFWDLSAFSRDFKQFFGISPSEARVKG